jgi:hypothetical protein
MREPWLTDQPSAYDMPVGTIVAMIGPSPMARFEPMRMFLKTADDVWESNVWKSTGRTGITRNGWIDGLFSDGYATVLRLGTGQ